MGKINRDNRGFGVVELVIVIVVVVVLSLVGWFIYDHKTTVSNKSVVTVPSSWKTFKDSSYPISFSYPSTWSVTPNSGGNPGLCDYEIGMGPYTQSYIAMICIKKESLATEISYQKASLNQIIDGHVSFKIISDIKLTIAGNSAEELSFQNIYYSGSGKLTYGQTEHYYYVYAKGYTYSLPPVYDSNWGAGNVTALESQELFKSIKID
jgi:hypothetical protein